MGEHLPRIAQSRSFEGKPPFRPVPFAPVDIAVEQRGDGSIVMRSRLEPTLRHGALPLYMAQHAASQPERIWLAQRTPGGGDWRTISFGEAARRIDGLTQSLLDLDRPEGTPLAVLSGNSIEHALIMLAAMQAHMPVVPISAAYSLMSTDHAKLREVLGTASPGVVFVQDGAQFGPALRAIPEGIAVIAADHVQPGQLDLRTLCERDPVTDMASRRAAIKPDAAAKIMFTSGSTGAPKGVRLTHEALVLVAESNLLTTGKINDSRRVRLDWAPWSHVFGATTLSLSIVEGGTFYLDGGRPVPGLFDETVRNLAEVQPDLFMNVPAAIAMLVEALEKDGATAARVLERLTALGYGGAALGEDTVRRFQALAVRHTGHRITITCGYGTTETGPGGGFVYWLTEATGTLGLPHPGFALKLVPLGDERFEVRVGSRAVTPGYVGRPDLIAEMFDDDGFYRTGDCVVLAESGQPLSGLVFAGRLNEEFKLQNGTFVRVGALRAAVLEAAAPLLKDVVICGENQAELAILAWPSADAAAALDQDELVREVTARLRTHNRGASATSRITRFRLLVTPPSIDTGEVTDKGSINQRAVQRCRPQDVAALFGEIVPPDTHLVAS